MEIFGIPIQAMMGQLLIGLINGSFYALLSLGLAVIFGLLNIINFAHGAQYMLGAFGAYLLLNKLGLGYWWSLLIVPIIVGATGLASGPHLHYEFRLAGKHRDPLTVTLPKEEPLPASELARFNKGSGVLLARLKMVDAVHLARRD